jgi:hypothetical protein
MDEFLAGGCRCGAVRYRASVEALPKAYACHCRDCQTWSGSAFSIQVVVPEGSLEVFGQPAVFELASGDGQRLLRHYACPVCFTRLFNTNSGRPGVVILRAGTLDRSDELEIVAHIWTARKLGGITIPPELPQWKQGAPLDQLTALLST